MLDCLYQLHTGAEDQKDMSVAMKSLCRIATETDAAVWFVHHARKADRTASSWKRTPDDVRGSSVIKAQTRTLLVMSQNPENTTDYWVATKANIEPLEPFAIESEPLGSGLMFRLGLPFAHKSEVTKHSGRFGALRRPTQRGVGGALRGPLVRTTQSSACSPRDRLDHRLGDRNAADWERSRRRDGVGPRGSGPQRGVDARAEPVRPRGRGWHSPRTWCASRCSPAT